MHISHTMTTEVTTPSDSNPTEQPTSNDSKLNQENLIDDAFYVEKKRWGTWESYYPDGKGIITTLTEEECVKATRFYLKGLQEGWDDTQTMVKSENSIVGGKL